MKPTTFPEANIVFAKDQPEYQPLPAFKEDSPKGEVITCWKLSFRERLTLLFSGKLWLAMLSFNKPLTPVFMTVKGSEVFETPEPKIDD
jgi:hypothetical protein